MAKNDYAYLLDVIPMTEVPKRNGHLAPTWFKPPAVKRWLRRVDYLVYLDMDLVVKRDDVDFVRSFITTSYPTQTLSAAGARPPLPDLVVTDHNKALNNGAFILRNSAWGNKFAARWAKISASGFRFPFSDNGSFIETILSFLADYGTDSSGGQRRGRRRLLLDEKTSRRLGGHGSRSGGKSSGGGGSGSTSSSRNSIPGGSTSRKSAIAAAHPCMQPGITAGPYLDCANKHLTKAVGKFTGKGDRWLFTSDGGVVRFVRPAAGFNSHAWNDKRPSQGWSREACFAEGSGFVLHTKEWDAEVPAGSGSCHLRAPLATKPGEHLYGKWGRCTLPKRPPKSLKMGVNRTMINWPVSCETGSWPHRSRPASDSGAIDAPRDEESSGSAERTRHERKRLHSRPLPPPPYPPPAPPAAVLHHKNSSTILLVGDKEGISSPAYFLSREEQREVTELLQNGSWDRTAAKFYSSSSPLSSFSVALPTVKVESPSPPLGAANSSACLALPPLSQVPTMRRNSRDRYGVVAAPKTATTSLTELMTDGGLVNACGGVLWQFKERAAKARGAAALGSSKQHRCPAGTKSPIRLMPYDFAYEVAVGAHKGEPRRSSHLLHSDYDEVQHHWRKSLGRKGGAGAGAGAGAAGFPTENNTLVPGAPLGPRLYMAIVIRDPVSRLYSAYVHGKEMKMRNQINPRDTPSMREREPFRHRAQKWRRF
jgi:hypothetical protein